MTTVVILVLALVGLALLLPRASPGWALLADRPHGLTDWSALYEQAQASVVAAALEEIRLSFFLRPDDLQRLKPEDSLLAIYRAAYPELGGVDSQEFESLYATLRSRFNVPADELQALSDPTVGDVLGLAVRYSGA
ncbi:hypothetical protein ACFONC_07330 [Luteimonas soli]|uniref:Tail specific protease N-terminal domain-containing protein n=1 Tax=Luteimonas soli TaxID=1648966 RepID=A0ABV7XLT5_9GAMM